MISLNKFILNSSYYYFGQGRESFPTYMSGKPPKLVATQRQRQTSWELYHIDAGFDLVDGYQGNLLFETLYYSGYHQ